MRRWIDVVSTDALSKIGAEELAVFGELIEAGLDVVPGVDAIGLRALAVADEP